MESEVPATSANDDDDDEDENYFFVLKNEEVSIPTYTRNYPFYTDVDGYEASNNSYYQYQDGFPIELLWDDNWEDTISNHTQEAIDKFTADRREKLRKKAEQRKAKKERDKLKHEQEKRLRPIIFEKIKNTLTEEEYEVFKRFLIPHRGNA